MDCLAPRVRPLSAGHRPQAQEVAAPAHPLAPAAAAGCGVARLSLAHGIAGKGQEGGGRTVDAGVWRRGHVPDGACGGGARDAGAERGGEEMRVAAAVRYRARQAKGTPSRHMNATASSLHCSSFHVSSSI